MPFMTGLIQGIIEIVRYTSYAWRLTHAYAHTHPESKPLLLQLGSVFIMLEDSRRDNKRYRALYFK